MLPLDLTHNQTHLRSHCHIYYDRGWYLWSRFVDARVSTKSNSAIFANSRANNSDSSGPITFIIKII